MERAFQDYAPERFSHCFGCGRNNQHGLHLKSYWDGNGGDTIARYTPRDYFTGGYPAHIFGGMIAVLFDCHGIATAMAETYKREGRAMDDALEPIRYVTASLSVEYKNPTPIGVELVLYGKTNAVEGRKAFVDLVLRAEGILCATGQMVAVRLPEDVMNASGH